MTDKYPKSSLGKQMKPFNEAFSGFDMLRDAMTETDAPVEVTKADMNIRAAIWNKLGDDVKMGKALTSYGMVRFAKTIDQIAAEHRLATEASKDAEIEHLIQAVDFVLSATPGTVGMTTAITLLRDARADLLGSK